MFNFLFFLESILLGLGLAMDAFSVSLADGLAEPGMRRKKALLIAGVFGIFQGLMPFLGWICVHTMVEIFSGIEVAIPWIALALLSFIGGKMLFDGISEMRCNCKEGEACEFRKKELVFSALLVQGIATSIDALSVGFTIADHSLLEALVAVLIIGAVTFATCVFGVNLGKRFGTALAGKSSVFGGAILIFIGLEIFITSFI